MKKKNLIMLLAGVALAIGVVAAARPGRTTSSLPEKADATFAASWGRKTLVIGLDDAFPPIGFRDAKGTLTGFDVELAQEACRRLGLKAVFQPVVWDSVILTLNKKDIDVIWNGMTITPQRQKQIAFSRPYLKGENVFLVPPGSPVKSKADLAGKTVAVQAGAEQDETIRKDALFPRLKELKTYDTVQAAFLDMKAGRVDAVLVDNFSGLYTARQVLGEDVQVSVIPGGYGQTQSGVGIRKEDMRLQQEIDRVIGEMMQDGTASRIAKKWFGNDGLLVK